MGKRIGLYIGGRRFDVDVDDKFALYLEDQMKKDFNVEGNNELKTVMQAYVRKSYELYKQDHKIEEIIKKINK
jgi:hypothetical protein